MRRDRQALRQVARFAPRVRECLSAATPPMADRRGLGEQGEHRSWVAALRALGGLESVKANDGPPPWFPKSAPQAKRTSGLQAGPEKPFDFSRANLADRWQAGSLNMAEAIRVASDAGARPQAGISVHPIRR